MEYTEQTCWATGVYYWHPKDQGLPKDDSDRENGRLWVSYVQWIPFLFLLLSGLFHVPPLVWRLVSRQSGYYVRHLFNYGIS